MIFVLLKCALTGWRPERVKAQQYLMIFVGNPDRLLNLIVSLCSTKYRMRIAISRHRLHTAGWDNDWPHNMGPWTIWNFNRNKGLSLCVYLDSKFQMQQGFWQKKVIFIAKGPELKPWRFQGYYICRI